MKTCKNILLISGIASVMFYVVLSVVQFITYLFTPLSGINYVIRGGIFPTIIAAGFLVLPIILLVRNLKNKKGKTFPIVCMITEGCFLSFILSNVILTPIFRYVSSELGIIGRGFNTIIYYWGNGTLFLIIGISLIMVGSILSLFKQKEKAKGN